MNIGIRVITIKTVLERFPDWDGRDKIRYNTDHERILFDIDDIPPDVFEEIRRILNDKASTETDRTALLTLKNYDALMQPYTGKKATVLEQLISGLKNFFEDSPNKWVFCVDPVDQRLMPMYVSSIRYYPDEWEVKGKKRRLIREATVEMYLNYVHRGSKCGKSVSWTRGYINRELGTSFEALLKVHGLVKETKIAVNGYKQDIARYQEISPMTGTQFLAQGYGRAYVQDRWNSRMRGGLVPMVRDGRGTKIVMDDEHEEGSSKHENPHGFTPSASNLFWVGTKLKKASDVKSEDELDELYQTEETEAEVKNDYVTLPTWPYLKVFDLDRHDFMEMHVADIEDYPWDVTVFDKLVLPVSHKRLISILVKGTNVLMEDIIIGKTGGIIALCTGNPGTGKTLTAEVFGEFIQRPVYKVKCAELGLDAATIETNLQKILTRAQRWNALLLLDEADVYIRHRGHDIRHNAIVGVFLQMLEYYRGVLFLTSNMVTIIDDAVLSRCTAHIRYEMPDDAMRHDLWRVLGEQYGVKFTAKELKELVERFKDVAGRDIKSMLKLGTLVSTDEGKRLDMDILADAYLFQDTAKSMEDAGKRLFGSE